MLSCLHGDYLLSKVLIRRAAGMDRLFQLSNIHMYDLVVNFAIQHIKFKFKFKIFIVIVTIQFVTIIQIIQINM
jgi:hypothetical protein